MSKAPPAPKTRTCECGVVFDLPSPTSNQRCCSQPCRAKAQTTASSKTANRPLPSPPKTDPNGLVWSGSGLVNCHGCGRTRERGRRCQCERLEGIAS